MQSGRAGISAAPLSPTQVLLAGGFSGVATIKNFSLNLAGKMLSSAELFDETTGVFSPTGAMGTPPILMRSANALPTGNAVRTEIETAMGSRSTRRAPRWATRIKAGRMPARR